jgi:zinc protease
MLLGRFEICGGWQALDRYLPEIRKVTAKDVQRVVQQYLVPDQRTAAILVPTGPAKHPVAPPSGMLH